MDKNKEQKKSSNSWLTRNYSLGKQNKTKLETIGIFESG